jgi:hypothetical protein
MQRLVVLRLPVDLLILIRSYLHHLVLSSFVENDDIEHFQHHECRRSWRNFLSVSNCHSWKAVRRETMIWTLNAFESLKYLKDGSFKTYVNERMIFPAQQLYLNLKGKRSRSSSLLVFVGRLSNCNLMSLSVDSPDITELPSNHRLKVLNIYNCERLKRLGDYPHLEHLQILVCDRLSVLGEMRNLEQLKLFEFGKVALASFPLETLTKLNITDSLVELIEVLPRFHKLIELTIENGNFGNRRGRNLPRLSLPQLRSLTLETFTSVDLTGLTSLKYLNLQDVRCAIEVIDKENIYPQLKSFFYDEEAAHEKHENLSAFSDPVLFANIRELSINLPKKIGDLMDLSTNSVGETFPVPEQLQSLTLNGSNYDMTRDSIWKKRKVSLTGCALNNIWCLSNVQSVRLVKCHQITDISPLASVPYLHLERLSEVRDFSCFETQKFLSITSCKGLRNPQLLASLGLYKHY